MCIALIAVGTVRTTGTTSLVFVWWCPHLSLVSDTSELCNSDFELQE